MILKTLIGVTALMMTSSAALAEMTEAEREAFRAEVRAFLLEEPEVLVEAMEVLQGQQDLQAAERDLQMLRDNADLIYRDPNSWAGGNLDADLTIVEFVDYRCGYCRRAHDEVSELVASDGNIRLVVKEFPILGEQSLLSSQFAIAVRQLHGDDAYKAAHDALITLRGDATPETLARLATDHHLAQRYRLHLGRGGLFCVGHRRCLGEHYQTLTGWRPVLPTKDPRVVQASARV